MSDARLLMFPIAALLAGPAQHASTAAPAAKGAGQSWTTLPLLAPGRTPPGDRSLARFVPRNLSATGIEIFAPDASAPNARSEALVQAEGAGFRVPKGQGNYYWISARQQDKESVVTASTVRYFSNPGPAPTELLTRRKGELELIPQPLPREHGNYRAGEEWEFLVRYRGQPLANIAVVLETEHGSRATFTSATNGMARVAFPLDFNKKKAAAEGEHAGHGAPRAAFVLAVEHTDAGVRHLTAFNHVYTPDAWDQKNLWAGLGFTAFGMLLAAPLLRRKKKDA